MPPDVSLLQLLAARYVLAELPVDDLPRLATDALVGGVESESLAALAGAERVTTAAELRDLFEAALSELGISLPEPVTAATLLKKAHAEDVVSGRLAPREGAARIVGLYYVIQALLCDRVYAADGFDIALLFGAYWAYDDEGANPRELDATVLEECRRIVERP